MTLTRAKVLTSLDSVEGRQRRYRARVRSFYSSGSITPESRVRARRAFGLLRVKRRRLVHWLVSHPERST